MLRVYELARELCLTNKAMMEKLSSMKIQVGSHMSSLKDDLVSSIKSSISVPTHSGGPRVQPTQINRLRRTVSASENSAEHGLMAMHSASYSWTLRARNNARITSLSERLGVTLDALWSQIDETGQRQRIENEGFSSRDRSIFSLINKRANTEEIASILKLNSEDLIYYFNCLGFQITKVDQIVGQHFILKLFKERRELFSKDGVELNPPLRKAALCGKTFLVDGFNVCHWLTGKRELISLNYLMALVRGLQLEGGSFICFFDPHTGSKLTKEPEHDCFTVLTSRAPRHFNVSSRGAEADKLILNMADKKPDYLIISNDLFSDYYRKYKWLWSKPQRLIQAKVVPVTFGPGKLAVNIPKLDLLLPIQNYTIEMAEAIIKDLNQP